MDRVELARRLGAPADEVAEAPAGPAIVAAETAPQFMRDLARAVAGGGPVFLADAAWGENERRQLEALRVRPALQPADAAGRGWLAIPTGGTGGKLRLARHDEETLWAAVGGFAAHFGIQKINAVGVLPLHHVSGLMGWMRCAMTGGEYVPANWKDLEAGRPPAAPARSGNWFLSLVPTQLERLLRGRAAVEWLRGFRAILVGGGPTGADLLDRAVGARLPIVLSYGMTETAAMVAAQRPEELAAGDRSCGRALPHARLGIEEGRVRIEGESVFRGYWPEWRSERRLLTDDLGSIDDEGRLRLAGRADQVIISGGEKINPAEVEAVLGETGEFAAVAVVGVADAEWGQVLAAAYRPRAGVLPDFERVRSAVAARLAPAKRPKHYVTVSAWPDAGPGKVDRRELASRVADAIRSGSGARRG